MRQARHARAPRRRAGLGAGEPRRDHALERRQGRRDQPVAFIGKGVVFDSGGISIKPGGGMEDMKGDMAGAACVVGLMHALASRKAKANVVGAIGLVENMPDGNAQRPGDIVTTHVGPDHRDHQHRRRGPARPGRRALVRAGPVQAEIHDRSRDPDRRDPRRAGAGICRPVLQQRRTGRAPRRGRPGHRRARLAHAARAGIRQDDRIPNSPT